MGSPFAARECGAEAISAMPGVIVGRALASGEGRSKTLAERELVGPSSRAEGAGRRSWRAASPARGLTLLRKQSSRFRLLWVSNLFFFGGVWTQTLILGWLVFETTSV